VGQEFLDCFIHGLTGLDEEHDAARALEVADHLLNGARANHARALRLAGEEFIHAGGCAVVGHDGVAVVIHV